MATIAQVAAYVKRIEHNVWLAYVYTLFFWSCRSILLDQVLAAYVYVLTGSNEPVGLVSGINGLVRLVVAIPGGYASDWLRRDTVLKVAGALGLVCVAMSMTSYLLGHMLLLYIAYGCWGAYFALQRPALEAIFADSVPQGERELPFTIKFMLMNVSGMVGPLASVVFFQWYGDLWSLSGLQWVLCGGLAVGTPGIVSLFFFNDDLACENLRPHQAASTAEPTRNQRALSYIDDSGDLAQVEEIPTEPVTTIAGEASPLLEADNQTAVVDLDTINTFLWLGPRHVPVILFCTDFIMYNGSGLSLVFLPLFLQNEYGLSPSSVNFLVLVQQVLVLAATSLAQVVSKKVGDIETVVSTRILAAAILMAFTYGESLWVEIVLFVLRTAIMRSSQPLRSSILMDHVRKEWRGRWNALESLTMFCFCGTSAVGGYLVEAYGYRTCFFVTSVIWFIGLMLEFVLVPIIRTERKLRHVAQPTKIVMLA
ncbi:hypothetical protein H310_08498 [Aphanomyces invadans]|uniref:Major facilitator superfamily (MFS) profile domain-containing protein n=1 Tax=Aphanomyces invadans TaxID=157072 RepID=A0A024TZJ1_9STRA|nr:hypothetical protein H310_08498 [Aphanomyces invadans]ETV99066.1 hypothetical protein H310_08498 [Aphanomyces invadans]|eukprot:XP_008872494.1 hypothetical protein H310_08498 [Aphanomyces invadans]